MLPIIGMSPGNSFFKHKSIAYLLRETIKEYGKAVIMIADQPAISTYLALGYTFSKARSKAILKGNNLKNKTKSVLEMMGLDSSNVIIVNRAEEIENNPEYKKVYKEISLLYKNNQVFSCSVKETSKSVLDNSGKEYGPEQIEQATHYLLSEIAFLEFAPKYFKVEKISYVYHLPRRIYEDYIAGLFDGKTRNNQDFILMEVPHETYFSEGERDLSRTEIITKKGLLKCGYTQYIGNFIQKNSVEFSGLFYDVIKKVAINNNLELKFTEQTGYGVIADRINGGYTDVFCAPVRPTKSRKLELFFSKSLFESDVYGYMKSNSIKTSMSFKQLQQDTSLRIAVKKNDIHHDIVTEFFPNARIVWIPQLSLVGEGINYVIENRADIAFWEDTLVEQFLKQKSIDLTTLHTLSYNNGPFKVYENCIALPRGEFALKDMIDEVIKDFINEKNNQC